MKRSFYILSAILFLLMASLSQCKKKTYTLDPPSSKVEGLNGDWELYSVIQVDEKSLSKDERDLSEFYIGDGSAELMNVSFSSSNKTFEIVLGEIGRNFLPSSGTWSFDDDNFPSYIYLEADNGEVTSLKLQSTTRPQDQKLKFSFQRSCTINGENLEYVGYRYELNRK